MTMRSGERKDVEGMEVGHDTSAIAAGEDVDVALLRPSVDPDTNTAEDVGAEIASVVEAPRAAQLNAPVTNVTSSQAVVFVKPSPNTL